MGFLNIFRKKDKPEVPQDAQNAGGLQPGRFVLGVSHVVPAPDSENVFVFGRLNGTVTVGDAVYVHNFGDDHAPTRPSAVMAIKKESGEMPRTASDCFISFLLEDAKQAQIKCGTLVFTHGMTVESQWRAYVNTLANVYVPNGDLRYKAEDAERLSLSDCQEILQIHSALRRKRQDQNAETTPQNQEAQAAYLGLLVEKLLAAKSIYVVFNRRTGEPHLFSNYFRQQDGTYFCTEPRIMLITQAFHDDLARQFPDESYEIREISNGDDKELENFLGSSFYLNGAGGVLMNCNDFPIKSDWLVKKPDFSHIPKIQRPVTNPDLMRWMLLVDQLGSPDTEEEKMAFQLYFGLLGRELLKAKLLQPMQYEGELIQEDESGKGVFKKGGEMRFPIIQGRDRQATRLYTDWKRFTEAQGSTWSGLIQTVDNVIEHFDCVINPDKDGKTGIYIDKTLFEKIRQNG